MTQEAIAPPAPPAPPSFPGLSLAETNQAEAIKLVQAQIDGVKKEISELTGQLVPGTTDAREGVIGQQIESATERLQSLQQQLDRMVTGERPLEGVTGFPNDGDQGIPPSVMQVIQWGMMTAVIISLGVPLVRMLARRLEPRARSDAAPDFAPRFERLEQAVDAVAIEVERISEGQRFTNRILGEAKALPAPNPLEQRLFAERQKVEERR